MSPGQNSWGAAPGAGSISCQLIRALSAVALFQLQPSFVTSTSESSAARRFRRRSSPFHCHWLYCCVVAAAAPCPYIKGMRVTYQTRCDSRNGPFTALHYAPRRLSFNLVGINPARKRQLVSLFFCPSLWSCDNAAGTAPVVVCAWTNWLHTLCTGAP